MNLHFAIKPIAGGIVRDEEPVLLFVDRAWLFLEMVNHQKNSLC